jgi:hypothetical protein
MTLGRQGDQALLRLSSARNLKASPTQSEKTSRRAPKAQTQISRAQRQPRCIRQRSRLISPPARSSLAGLLVGRFSYSLLRALCACASSRRASAANPLFSKACALLLSLCALFRARIICFQQLARSFAKIPGWGVPLGALDGSAVLSICLCFVFILLRIPFSATHLFS